MTVKYFVKVMYKNHIYLGASYAVTEKELEEMEELLSTVARGGMDHLQITTDDDCIHFFSKKILKRSVITLEKQVS